MESQTNKAWVLKSYPTGALKNENFGLVDIEYPKTLGQNQVLFQLVYLSVDPYMRGRCNNQKGYFVGPFEVDKPLSGGAIARVVESKDANVKVGEVYQGFFQFQIFQVTKVTQGYIKVTEIPGVPLHFYLGVLGLTGLSAYLPLIKIGKPKAGQTIFVSGAAGAVGLVVGQVAKILGLKVYGSAGTDDQVELLKSLGFDGVYNYKQTQTDAFLQEHVPQGVDIYFDNVGGEILDDTLTNMNVNGRVIACGSISQYDVDPQDRYGVQNIFAITTKRLIFQGFIVSDWVTEWKDGVTQLLTWVSEGQLQSQETIFKGFDQTIEAFIGLFVGANTGKAVIEV